MMNTEDLSFVADALLAIVGEDADSPFEYDFAPRAATFPRAKINAFIQVASQRRPADVLLKSECEEILERANLTDNQAEVLDLRLGGMSFDQIGVRKGRSRQGAMKTFLIAVKKIGRVMRVYPYTGLSDVYRYEVRRGLPKGAFGKMVH